MTIELGVLAAHVPSICHRENVPEFQWDIVKKLDDISGQIKELKPDAVVIVSCHWQSTFHHYVDVSPQHQGILTAFECPDIISDVAYEYPGDQDLGEALVLAGKQARLPVIAVNDPTYVWDYGTVVPLRYLVPNEDIPVVNLSITMAAGLDETYKWGEVIGETLNQSDKRYVFVFSGALAHNLVRGRHHMPTVSEQALDKQFIDYVMNRDMDLAKEMLPQYAKVAGVEGGGRHLAMMLGTLKGKFKPAFLSYAQSSGSGNAIMTFENEEKLQGSL
ncbi:DODA-type extradiol aromatic ring-opening family dioxygenase [Alkalihalophilus marmarensis]|uniref:DODA-type extradiol aromatic ring-opening family dioxygenase n=1 Tax=Alkalihalophilus marmarensis TaxID=521377 RepID=UPI002DB8D2E1|nr:extradiol ring-cleavage dioxygenase [Alkalihalophilus marmarensis]MEC2073281.1 extradiol ring-cleavage dioxygenase [Alkalihalophilus marmarensis]